MSPSPRTRRRLRTVTAVLLMLTLLYQGTLALACELHDAAHVAEAAAHGHAVDDHSQHDDDEPGDAWHDLFQAGHHCAQVLLPPAIFAPALTVPTAARPPTAVLIAAVAAPASRLLRPPIHA